ncbi:MAG: helicase HerA domain-containing protein [Candidatus Nanohaloarchaea archaeon]
MQLGTIEGEVDTSSFTFRAVEEVKKFDFVSVKSNGNWILAQVEEVTKHPDGETLAKANIIGYRDKGLTKAPRRVLEPDSIVYRADQELISETLGLKDSGLRIGTLETNPDIDIHVNADDFYKHFAVLAQTGAGKSYLTGVLIEELLESDYPILILDPHGEYSSLKLPNEDSDEPRGYEVREYSPNTDVNSEALPLSFSSLNMSKKELQTLIPDSLTNSQMGVLYNAMKRLDEKDEDYSLNDLMDAVSHEDSTAKWNLLNYLEQLEDTGLFSEDPVDLENLLEPGRATVVNLRAVEPEAAEMTVYMLAKKLFDLRKTNDIPPFITVIEEAHNFVPEKGFGQALSNDIMRKIASEGRKFGLGLGVISQRPARIDKNVLSQANTQFILRVTNPNDLKAISKSFEGITSEVESMIKSLPPGVAFVLGNEYPVMTDVRTRKSRHGGETQTADDYVESEKVEMFRPQKSLQEVETEFGEKYSAAYYPLYLVETEDKQVLVDGVNGEVKEERSKPGELEREILAKLSEGMDRNQVIEELGLELSKLASKIDSLRDKGLLKEDELSPVESLFDVDIEEKKVEAESLIEYELSPDDIEGDARRVRYPYYSRGEDVYDPVLGKEI